MKLFNPLVALTTAIIIALGWILGALFQTEIPKYGLLGAILLEIAAMAFIILMVSVERES